MENLLPLLVYFACSLWRLKFCCFRGSLVLCVSCGGGLAVASFVRVLFCFLIIFCKTCSLLIHNRHALAAVSSEKKSHRFRACLVGLIPRLRLLRRSSTKQFAREAVFKENRGARAVFGGATNCGSSKIAPAPLEEPLKRSPVKHPLISTSTTS